MCILLVVNGLVIPTLAQDYHLDIRHLGVKEGLLHREVNVIHLDRSGFLWIATPLGLNRYDGYHFKYFTRKTHGFQANRFEIITEDQLGRLWLFGLDAKRHSGNITSIDVLDPKKDQAFSFQSLFPDNSLFSPQDLRAICLTSPKGELIFQHADSLHLIFYDTQTGFRKLELPDFPAFQLRFISPQGTLWGKMDNNNWVEISLAGELIQTVLFDQHTYTSSIPEVSETGFYLYTFEPVSSTFFVNWQGEKIDITQSGWHADDMLMPNLRFFSALLTSQARQINSQIGEADIFPEMADYFMEREGTNFRNFCQAKQGDLWLGGNFGLYQIQVYPNPFKTILANPYEERTRNNNVACRGLWTDGHQLVINQDPRISVRVDLETGEHQILDKGKCDSWGNLVISPYSKGGFFMSTSNCLMQVNENFELQQTWPDVREAWAIFEENPQHIWLGMAFQRGISILNLENGTVKTAQTDKKLTPFSGKNINHISADRANRIWICSDDGLFRFERSDSSFVYYGSKGVGENLLPADDYLHFCEDKTGVFWLATKGEGLIRWDQQGDSINHFKREDGLPNNTLYAVYEDDFDNLWVPSDYGIIQFNKNSFTNRTYLPEDGTSEIEFNRISHTRGPDGRLFFGSLNGVTSFHPRDFYEINQQEATGPPLHITRTSQFDAEQNRLLDKTIEVLQTQTITLNADDRYFRIEMAMLEFGDNELTQYMWRIEKWEDVWQIQEDPFIQLSRLPYGTYRMHIKARTARGEYSANDLHLTIKVVRPFYLTTAFIIIVVLGLLLALGLGVYMRIRQLRIIQEKLEQKVDEATRELREMDRLKTRLFANVSHELRTPLSLILGPISTVLKRNHIEKKDANYLQLARQSGQSLQRLITEILDLGKLESGKLTPSESPVNFSNFLKKKAASFKAVAENEGLTLDFQSDLPPDTFLRCDRLMVEKVINNLLSNAIKFTPEGGRVTFESSIVREFERFSQLTNPRTHELPNFLTISVSDTGSGIHPDDLPYIFDRYYQAQKGKEQLSGGTGIGLALSKELAELMGGSLEVASEWQKGSVFTFCLPYQEEGFVGNTEEFRSDIEDDSSVETPEIVPAMATATEQDRQTGIRILVTEDNLDLRQYLQSLLEPAYQVVTARHGREALQILEDSVANPASHNPIDLIVTDLMMPEMDGFTLLEHIKKHPDLRDKPVVMLTARTGIHDKLKALVLGVHDYLTKPFEEDELLIRIENLLGWANVRKAEKEDSEELREEPFSPHTSWLQEVDSWVEQYYQSSDIRMSDWAMSLNLSESQFRRKIKQASGLSPQQYLQEYRLKAARRMLEEQAVSTVAEVAYEVGFSAADYFSKVFHKRFGKLPSQYFAA